uniref:Glutamine synthetase n=1 Tax=Thermosphaera aggregans TaxID=54254 RepID=A0A7C2BK90_9CREN
MEQEKLKILYPDVTGVLREVEVFLHQMPDYLYGFKVSIDGSSLPGYASVENGDLFLKPASGRMVDLRSYGSGLLVVGELYSSTGERHYLDTRLVAEETAKYLSEQELEGLVGYELEFFMMRRIKHYLDSRRQLLYAQPVENTGLTKQGNGKYFASIQTKVTEVLGEATASLVKAGIIPFKIHRENGVLNQYEISFHPSPLLDSCDNIVLSIKTIREVSRAKKMTAVFMPKPFPEDYGNGLHLHISLWVGARNILFEDRTLSQEGRYFIGGVLQHARSIAAFTNPSLNSYKRLAPGYEAPVHIAWGYGNRTVMVRVPRNGESIEIRNPDASMNPYLGIPAVILAGLDGLKKKIEPGDAVELNLHEKQVSPNKRRLPSSLKEALEELMSDYEYLKPAFTKSFIEKYIELKMREVIAERNVPNVLEYQLLEHIS